MKLNDDEVDRLTGLFVEEREGFAAVAAERGLTGSVDELARTVPSKTLAEINGEAAKRGEARRIADLQAGKPVEFAERFGKYGLLRELGRGGLGRVWLAWDPDLKRLVALKVLGGGDDARRLQREAQVAARLQHPRIAAVYEAGEAHGVPFIAMQYLDGNSLEGRMLDPLEAARVARDAARVLQWAHERGVVHRDVKPGNLMLVNGEVYLVDFGLARPVGGAGSLTGGIAGTMAYMSREQAAGEAPSPDFDVYSLGAALYRLATGRAPVEAGTMLELLTKLETPAAAPRAINPAIPIALQSVIVKAMDERGHRYATAAAMADDLDRVLRGEPVDIRGRRLRSLKRAMPAVAVGVLALVAVLFGWRRLEDHARADRLVEKARQTVEDARVRLYMKGVKFTDAFYSELDGALAQARESAKLKASADACVLIGRIEQLKGNHEAARAAFAKAGTPEGKLRLARSYVEEAAEEIFAGREENGALLLMSAQRHFDEAGETTGVDRDLVEAWRLVAAGDYEGAAEWARPRTVASEEFWVVLGLAGFRRDPNRLALRELSGAIEARPNYYQAYVCRAYLLKSRNSLDYARKDAERAIEIHPRYARAWDALAEILHESGDRDGEAKARAEAERLRTERARE